MIAVRGLSKAYAGRPALQDVSLHAAAGEMCVVLGPSGAGKTTLLRCINRLVEPDGGDIVIDGQPAPTTRAGLRALRQNAAMIFQDHHLVPRLSALKNVLTGRLASLPLTLSLLQIFPGRDVDIALDCLQRVELRERAWSRADRLSGGERQRVGIARALAQQPRVILADEPVASLDPKTARVVLNDLRRAAHELNIAVLCNLHQVEYAREFADHLVGISAGRTVFDGSVAQLDDAALERIYSGDLQAGLTRHRSGASEGPRTT